jgi:DNA-binding SARP family transcriptional activator
VLIRAYLKEGNRGEAVRQYEACRQVLRRELGIEPSPVTQALLSSPVARTLQAVTVRRRCGGAGRGG